MRLRFAYTTAKQMKRTYGRDRSGGVEAVPKRSEGMSHEDGEVWIARPLRLQSSRGGNANLLFLRRFRLFQFLYKFRKFHRRKLLLKRFLRVRKVGV